ncbi:hypothetical protein [Lacinutrix jangbogonensis]|uniref:hypothetical protein n=1 Tax=Lacinutrix jangbogonensis TaxID=1469557 RepID=UPI00053D128F|nr:hypothetical protein [Lacinutrix jangbogonensis]
MITLEPLGNKKLEQSSKHHFFYLILLDTEWGNRKLILDFLNTMKQDFEATKAVNSLINF